MGSVPQQPRGRGHEKPLDGRWVWDIWAKELPMIGFLGEPWAAIIVKNGLRNYEEGSPMDNETDDEHLYSPQTLYWNESDKHSQGQVIHKLVTSEGGTGAHPLSVTRARRPIKCRSDEQKGAAGYFVFILSDPSEKISYCARYSRESAMFPSRQGSSEQRT